MLGIGMLKVGVLRAATIALALASLGACASIGCACTPNATLMAGPITRPISPITSPITNFVAGMAAAPMEEIAPVASRALERRRFALPSDRQPDLRMVFATSADRGRRRLRRHRRRNA